jgi:hypothetical protein
MKLHNHVQILEATAKGLGKWCMYASFTPPCDYEGEEYEGVLLETELLKAAPWAKDLGQEILTFLLDAGGGIISFDSEGECIAAYEATVGDDGPTKTNSYSGPLRVYALTCDPQGQTQNENT